MTGGTVAFPDRFMGGTELELAFQLDMTGIADGIGTIIQHVFRIGAMGVMTGTALLLDKRLMLLFQSFAPFFGLFMAAETKSAAGQIQKTLVPAGMRGMAGKAAPFALDGSVGVQHFYPGIFMA
jgi:hypothetical protein